jgi:uncharacterized protein
MSTNGKPILQRTFQAPLEAKEGRILEGCCVPYGEAQKVRDAPDGPAYYEVFQPGAFRKQLKAADKLELRYEHRDELAHSIGVCRALHEEASGLYGEFKIHDDPLGDRALNMVREGILPGFSVSFWDTFTHWKRNAEGAIERMDCRLDHVALVRQPAYVGALVTGMRSREELLGEIELPEVADEQLERLRAVGIQV